MIPARGSLNLKYEVVWSTEPKSLILLYNLKLTIISVTDLEILVVLVTRLLRQDLDRLVNGIELVEPWDKG
jgi:hypothetical protein